MNKQPAGLRLRLATVLALCVMLAAGCSGKGAVGVPVSSPTETTTAAAPTLPPDINNVVLATEGGLVEHPLG